MLPIDGTLTVALPTALAYEITVDDVLEAASVFRTNVGTIVISKPIMKRIVIVDVSVFRIFLFSFQLGTSCHRAPTHSALLKKDSTETPEIIAPQAPSANPSPKLDS